jgi:hypothetical protein
VRLVPFLGLEPIRLDLFTWRPKIMPPPLPSALEGVAGDTLRFDAVRSGTDHHRRTAGIVGVWSQDILDRSFSRHA